MKQCVFMLVTFFVLNIWADDFWKWYGNKGAEISSYKTLQPRYGELHDAYTVMIFVPEHTNRKTMIKVEDYSATPKEDRIQVLKLNRVLHFDTGIYHYAVTTSVFSAMQEVYGRKMFQPVKISISSSEWCGNFYEHLLPYEKGTKRIMHSYFEKEGDKEDTIPSPENGEFEDNFPVLIREFKGEYLKPGQKKKLSVMQSLWDSRITHAPLEYRTGWLKKENGKPVRLNLKTYNTYKWSWQVGKRMQEYWVDKDYPHLILKWESSNGERGELIKTIRLKYWHKNTIKDKALRKRLGIPVIP